VKKQIVPGLQLLMAAFRAGQFGFQSDLEDNDPGNIAIKNNPRPCRIQRFANDYKL
jgi:hypothetical protein